jgi:hypothetical protein
MDFIICSVVVQNIPNFDSIYDIPVYHVIDYEILLPSQKHLKIMLIFLLCLFFRLRNLG